MECKKFYCITYFTIEYNSLYSIEFKYKMFFSTTINKWNIKSKVKKESIKIILNLYSSVNIEYSVDFGKNWYLLLNPCYIDSACSQDAQHIYSSKIVLPSS